MAKKNKKNAKNEMTLNTYLSNFSKKRNLDKVILLWYQRIDPKNPKKTREKWNKIIEKFFNETER